MIVVLAAAAWLWRRRATAAEGSGGGTEMTENPIKRHGAKHVSYREALAGVNPVAAAVGAGAEAEQAPMGGWTRHLDEESGDYYFYNEALETTQWDTPAAWKAAAHVSIG